MTRDGGRYPPEAENLILQAFEDDPTTSTRKVAADLEKDPTRLLQKLGLFLVDEESDQMLFLSAGASRDLIDWKAPSDTNTLPEVIHELVEHSLLACLGYDGFMYYPAARSAIPGFFRRYLCRGSQPAYCWRDRGAGWRSCSTAHVIAVHRFVCLTARYGLSWPNNTSDSKCSNRPPGVKTSSLPSKRARTCGLDFKEVHH
ncbi:unnamed protein product [Acanthoscelides obtectus]|uniref:Uncharacterized protein n=1 Tax=Acanthoscelides obtectus TaxID=200917 RepID=A0A9P0PBF5_ACAOB|nr:unnamed protein product [Acanthoscelides obtectus]CAK1671628.1 hypothetical protein AOBTE_LOCUS28370 [Acanthoscelides obtectus]